MIVEMNQVKTMIRVSKVKMTKVLLVFLKREITSKNFQMALNPNKKSHIVTMNSLRIRK